MTLRLYITGHGEWSPNYTWQPFTAEKRKVICTLMI